MTWLIFRLEDTSLLFKSLKTYVGIDAYWDFQEMLEFLPEIKYFTLAIVGIFVIGHFLSWKLGGVKIWISQQNSVVWGMIIGVMLVLMLFMRPSESIDFIYFRF